MVSIKRIENGVHEELFPHVVNAENFWLRLKGLLGKSSVDEKEGMLFCPCSQVHTIGMKMPIDIIFLSREKRVLKIVSQLKPYRQATKRTSKYVLEVGPGMVAKHDIKIGDQFTW